MSQPANVLLAEDGTPRLTDFGIALLDQRQTRLTQQGTMLGSPAYLSPEMFQGEELDQCSDIWSFGVLLYEMLAGLNPFDKPTISATLMAILSQVPPAIQELRPDVPLPLVELLQEMLVKERAQCLDSARQAAATLERIVISH